MTNHLIDLSHEVEDGLITYKGLPTPIICDYLSREASRRNYAEQSKGVRDIPRASVRSFG